MEENLNIKTNISENIQGEKNTTLLEKKDFQDTRSLGSMEQEKDITTFEDKNAKSQASLEPSKETDFSRTESLPKQDTLRPPSEETLKHNKGGSESQPPLPEEPVPEEYRQAAQKEHDTQPPLPDEPVPGDYQQPGQEGFESQPPLPDEPVPEEYQPPVQEGSESQPPLPDEPVPEKSKYVANDSEPATSGTEESASQPSIAWSEDQQVAAIWDKNAQAYYFWDRRTNTTSWLNPLEESDSEDKSSDKYAARVQFNRLSGKYMPEWATPEMKSEEYKAHKHMGQFFDVDTAMSSTQGKSLLEERRNRKYTRKEMEEMKKRNKEKKEQKRRAMFDIASDDKDFRRRKIIRY
ncbi:SOCG_03062-like, conserved protein [Schizosaccharomyces osmophilus]|uniref:SOCG_03062-like, conserved protein n=1 Tax=Schizosaccharomyces osmophilus TaxID=2545709 RepID=A0AAE9WEX4_9SCHI|nr:SOCG_03062-like, conserved protein [Schizosaccharomyces osmophilus]WBW75097.1 SOCG_03062-like, conserved protein [Schizosaccharomyces osmophilus]